MAPHDRPAAEGIGPGHFPPSPVPAGHVAASPRRVRGMVGDDWIFDTVRALYVWEHPYYAQYHIPTDDVREDLLVDEGEHTTTDRGTFSLRTINTNGQVRSGGAGLLTEPAQAALADTYRFTWSAIDHWFEEDEEIFVHPRSPYVRVDALRSARPIRVEVDGTVLAEASGFVTVFETGLPPRRYLAKTAVDWRLLTATDTETQCPYKGTTSHHWSAHVGGRVLEDAAWCYDFPTRALTAISGLVAFDDEQVDVFVDGEPASP